MKPRRQFLPKERWVCKESAKQALIEKVVGSVDGFTELLPNIGGLAGLARSEESCRSET